MHVVKPYVVTYAVFRLYHPPSRSKNDRCSPMCVYSVHRLLDHMLYLMLSKLYTLWRFVLAPGRGRVEPPVPAVQVYRPSGGQVLLLWDDGGGLGADPHPVPDGPTVGVTIPRVFARGEGGGGGAESNPQPGHEAQIFGIGCSGMWAKCNIGEMMTVIIFFTDVLFVCTFLDCSRVQFYKYNSTIHLQGRSTSPKYTCKVIF